MFSIAICDDEQYICTELEAILHEYEEESLEIEVFSKGEALYTEIARGAHFDLIFLDIELGKMSGVDVGNGIRDILKDELTQIVFISSKQSYAMELFDLRPLNFLVKPLKTEKVFSVLLTARELSTRENNFFEFHGKGLQCRIPYGEIHYFEGNNKKISLFVAGNSYEFYGKLSDIVEMTANKDFLRIHQSYLVNYHQIHHTAHELVFLESGVQLPISQPYRKAVREKMFAMRRGEF